MRKIKLKRPFRSAQPETPPRSLRDQILGDIESKPLPRVWEAFFPIETPPQSRREMLRDIESRPLPRVGKYLLPLIEHLGIDDIIHLDYLKFESVDDFNAQIEVSREGFYIYKKNKARLVSYIDEFSRYQQQYKSLPKYHIYAHCKMIKNPHTYVYSSDTSGSFEGDMGKHPLNLCRACAEIYRAQFHREFNLKEFITR